MKRKIIFGAMIFLASGSAFAADGLEGKWQYVSEMCGSKLRVGKGNEAADITITFSGQNVTLEQKSGSCQVEVRSTWQEPSLDTLVFADGTAVSQGCGGPPTTQQAERNVMDYILQGDNLYLQSESDSSCEDGSAEIVAYKRI